MMPTAPSQRHHVEPPEHQLVAPRLVGAGSLRHELESVLSAVSADAQQEVYKDAILTNNAAGKTSASSRIWAWRRLRLRYVLDPTLEEFRAFRAGMDATSDPNERGLLCFLMFARTDRLFREVTLTSIFH